MFFYNNVRRKFGIGIIMDISQNERQSHAAFGSKRLRLRLPLGAKSTESASSLCSANQTPLRPSPSAIAKALPFIGRSCFVEARKAFGFSAKMFSGTAYRPCHLSSSPIRPLFLPPISVGNQNTNEKSVSKIPFGLKEPEKRF